MPPRRRPRARSVWRVLSRASALTLGAALGAMGVLLPLELPAQMGGSVAPAAAQGEDPEAPVPQLHIAPVNAVVADDTEEIEFSILVANPGEEAIPGGTLALFRESVAVASTDDLDAEFSSDDALFMGAQDLDGTAAEGEQVVTVSLPRAEFMLNSFDPEGVYRVQAVLQTTGEDPAPADSAAEQPADTPEDLPDPANDSLVLTATTALVWGGAGDADPIELSTIVPLVMPADTYAVPSKDQLADAMPSLSATLEVAESTASTLAIDPRIIAAIRAYGTDAPAASRDFLDELETTTAPSFLLQFADADPAAQAALGFDELLAPTNLDYITRDGSFPVDDAEDAGTEDEDRGGATPGNDADAPAPGRTVPESSASDANGGQNADQNADAGQNAAGGENGAAEGAEPAVPGAPSLDELLAWPGAMSAAWPSPGEVDAATLDLLRREGIDTVVLDASNVSGATAPHVALGDIDAIVTDSRLGAAIGQALAAPSEVESLGGVASATAELVLAAAADPGGVVVALDRAAATESESIAGVLEQLTALDWVSPVPVETQAEGTGDLAPGRGLEPRLEQLQAAVDREPEVMAMSPLLEQPEYLVGYQRARLLGLFATRFAATEGGFNAAAERFRTRDAQLLDGVQVIGSADTQLVGTSTRIPVQVHNAMPFDAVVTGEVRPASAALRITERDIESTVVPADGNQIILVPVHTRVSSGSSGLIVTLTDATGSTEFTSETIPISINSSVETIALAILAVLAATLLGLGVWRSVRRRRSGHTDDAQGPKPDPGITEP